MTTTMIRKNEGVLGLSEYAMYLPEVVEKARMLEQDRQFHRLVTEQLVTMKRFTHSKAKQTEDAFLRFALIATMSDKVVSPSEEADDYWHEFILHTRLYARWCNRHFGHFFHHEPLTREELEVTGIPEYTEKMYHLYFGKVGHLSSAGTCSTSAWDSGGTCGGQGGGSCRSG